MDHKKILQEWLNNLHSKVTDNVTVVTPKELGQKYLFHISKDTNIREFIPRIGNRQGKTEDRTVPRITVAPTILGCLIGYASILYDFFELVPDGSTDEQGYKGGYKIYAFEFNAAVKPNGRLVYDANMSDEHWLVSFSPDNSTYKAINAGKLFYKNMQSTGRNDKLPKVSGQLYIEITLDEGVSFSKNLFLSKGHYLITGDIPNFVKSWETDKTIKVATIDKATFMTAKGESAALLGYQDKLPSYTKW